jgi:hypothetical protein
VVTGPKSDPEEMKQVADELDEVGLPLEAGELRQVAETVRRSGTPLLGQGGQGETQPGIQGGTARRPLVAPTTQIASVAHATPRYDVSFEIADPTIVYRGIPESRPVNVRAILRGAVDPQIVLWAGQLVAELDASTFAVTGPPDGVTTDSELEGVLLARMRLPGEPSITPPLSPDLAERRDFLLPGGVSGPPLPAATALDFIRLSRSITDRHPGQFLELVQQLQGFATRLGAR